MVSAAETGRKNPWGYRPMETTRLGLEVVEMEGQRILARKSSETAKLVTPRWGEFVNVVRSVDAALNSQTDEYNRSSLRRRLASLIESNEDFSDVPLYLIPRVVLGTVSYEEAMEAKAALHARRANGEQNTPQTARDISSGATRVITAEEERLLRRFRTIEEQSPQPITVRRRAEKKSKDTPFSPNYVMREEKTLEVSNNPRLTQDERFRLYQVLSDLDRIVIGHYGIEMDSHQKDLLEIAVRKMRLKMRHSFDARAILAARGLGPKLRAFFQDPRGFREKNASSPGALAMADALEPVYPHRRDELIAIISLDSVA